MAEQKKQAINTQAKAQVKKSANSPVKPTSTKTLKTASKKTSTKSTVSQKQVKKVTKAINNASPTTVIFLMFVLIGIVVAYLVYPAIIKNDFSIIAYDYRDTLTNNDNQKTTDIFEVDNDYVVLFINDTYHEYGCKLFVNNQDKHEEVETSYYYRVDLSEDSVKVDSVDTSKVGYYYAVYKCLNNKFLNTELIRTINIVERDNHE